MRGEKGGDQEREGEGGVWRNSVGVPVQLGGGTSNGVGRNNSSVMIPNAMRGWIRNT